jgi:hypothetical protein
MKEEPRASPKKKNSNDRKTSPDSIPEKRIRHGGKETREELDKQSDRRDVPQGPGEERMGQSSAPFQEGRMALLVRKVMPPVR